jgi:hypothetical protein
MTCRGYTPYQEGLNTLDWLRHHDFSPDYHAALRSHQQTAFTRHGIINNLRME